MGETVLPVAISTNAIWDLTIAVMRRLVPISQEVIPAIAGRDTEEWAKTASTSTNAPKI